MKRKNIFICKECGYESVKWMGKCNNCGEWNSFEEAPGLQFDTTANISEEKGAVWLQDISYHEQERIPTGMGELDRVLGGGIVPGSLVLLGGEPGIGKSTLLTQVAGMLAQNKGLVLYVSGEESSAQIKMRSERLGFGKAPVLVLVNNDYEMIEHEIKKYKPLIIIVDSIQTIVDRTLPGLPGSVTQVRECAGNFLALAKQTGIPIFLVGHITKSGALAGPKVLEHMVDTVLYFEGDNQHLYRLLRAVKNRFGPTNELGVFLINNDGLKEISNPSAFFIQSKPANSPGSVITAGMEGTRPFMIEIQALVSGNNYGGTPRRLVSGMEYNRVAMILAVLEKKLGWPLGAQDIYVSVVGGVTLLETASDLAVACAVGSSLRNKALDSKLVVFGEIGLSGEIRPVPQAEMRVREAVKLGFHHIILPKVNLAKVPLMEGIHFTGIEKLSEVLSFI